MTNPAKPLPTAWGSSFHARASADKGKVGMRFALTNSPVTASPEQLSMAGANAVGDVTINRRFWIAMTDTGYKVRLDRIDAEKAAIPTPVDVPFENRIMNVETTSYMATYPIGLEPPSATSDKSLTACFGGRRTVTAAPKGPSSGMLEVAPGVYSPRGAILLSDNFGDMFFLDGANAAGLPVLVGSHAGRTVVNHLNAEVQLVTGPNGGTAKNHYLTWAGVGGIYGWHNDALATRFRQVFNLDMASQASLEMCLHPGLSGATLAHGVYIHGLSSIVTGFDVTIDANGVHQLDNWYCSVPSPKLVSAIRFAADNVDEPVKAQLRSAAASMEQGPQRDTRLVVSERTAFATQDVMNGRPFVAAIDAGMTRDEVLATEISGRTVARWREMGLALAPSHILGGGRVRASNPGTVYSVIKQGGVFSVHPAERGPGNVIVDFNIPITLEGGSDSIRSPQEVANAVAIHFGMPVSEISTVAQMLAARLSPSQLVDDLPSDLPMAWLEWVEMSKMAYFFKLIRMSVLTPYA